MSPSVAFIKPGRAVREVNSYIIGSLTKEFYGLNLCLIYSRHR